MSTAHPAPAHDARTKPAPSALEARLDGIGWRLFLVMTGVIWLLPERRVPSGT